MSSLTIIQLFPPTVLTTSAATLFIMATSPPAVVLRNGRIRFTNTTAGPVSVTAYAIQSGGTASASNAFLNGETIAPNSHLDSDIPMLAVSGFVQALASANTSVTATALDGVTFNG